MTPQPPGTATPEPAILTRIQDPQWFALSWYGQTVERVCRMKGLVALRPGDLDDSVWAQLPGLDSGHVLAASPDLRSVELDPAATVVVGGPCIGDCTSYPTLEALYDSVQALEMARRLEVPALLFLGDQEEILERGGPGRWIKLAERIENWLGAIADAIPSVRLTVVRTSGAAHRSAIEPAMAALAGAGPEWLDAAFHLAAAAPRPQSEVARSVARRVIAAHFPDTVARHLPEVGAAPLVVVAENLQQAGVWRTAAAVHGGAPGALVFVGHWPAPSLSGGERMFRAQSTDKAPAWMLEEVAAGEVAGVHPYSVEFYSRWLTPELRAELSRRARDAWMRG